MSAVDSYVTRNREKFMSLSASNADVFPDAAERVSHRAGRDADDEAGYFTLEGRCGVLAYHARTVIMLIGVVPLTFVASLLGGFGAVLIAGVVIAAMLFMFFASVQRLHDLNFSAWFLLVLLIPIVGVLFSLYMMLMPGKCDDNNFGDWHEASGVEKLLGFIGIGIVVLAVIAGVLGAGSAA